MRHFGAKGVKVAAVNGALITDRVLELTDRIIENGEPTKTLAPKLISAEAYLGAENIRGQSNHSLGLEDHDAHFAGG